MTDKQLAVFMEEYTVRLGRLLAALNKKLPLVVDNTPGIPAKEAPYVSEALALMELLDDMRAVVRDLQKS